MNRFLLVTFLLVVLPFSLSCQDGSDDPAGDQPATGEDQQALDDPTQPADGTDEAPTGDPATSAEDDPAATGPDQTPVDLPSALDEVLASFNPGDGQTPPTTTPDNSVESEDIEDDDEVLAAIEELNEGLEIETPDASLTALGTTAYALKLQLDRTILDQDRLGEGELRERLDDGLATATRPTETNRFRLATRQFYTCGALPCRLKHLEFAQAFSGRLGAARSVTTDFVYSSSRGDASGDLNETKAYRRDGSAGDPAWVTSTSTIRQVLGERELVEEVELTYFENPRQDVSFLHQRTSSGKEGFKTIYLERSFEQASGDQSDVPPAQRDGSGRIVRIVTFLDGTTREVIRTFTRLDGILTGTIEGLDRRGRTLEGTFSIDDGNNLCPFDNKGELRFTLHYADASADADASPDLAAPETSADECRGLCYAGRRTREEILAELDGPETSIHGTLFLRDGSTKEKRLTASMVAPETCGTYKSRREALLDQTALSARTTTITGTRYDGAKLALTSEVWKGLRHTYGTIENGERERELDFVAYHGFRVQR